MADFWLISVPLDKTTSASVEKLKRAITKTQLCSNWKFSIPDLKVSLPHISQGYFSSCYFVILPAVWCWICVVPLHFCHCCTRVLKPLLKLVFFSVNMMKYVTKFQWDTAKYPPALPLSSLVDIIGKEVLQVETEFKSRASAYYSLKANLEHKLNNSGYLTTLLVVVNRYLQWERSYESLSQFVVPGSSRKLFEDGEGGIFSVTLFKRVECEFKAKAQESKFIVREYCFDQEEREQQKIREYTILKREQYEIFVRWLMVNFSQLFIAWIHLKAIGVFVESVLRYGLPVNYQALLLQTDKKHSKKLRDTLSSLFKHLDPTDSLKYVSCDIPGLCQEEYSSYICFPINTSML
uniref:V-type proton ATPase subunit C n=1 Tax=Oryzias latipes TaxID=8090 RepID=A0A3P9MD44_ORYLA